MQLIYTSFFRIFRSVHNWASGQSPRTTVLTNPFTMQLRRSGNVFLLSYLACTLASSSVYYCKCTCNKNSTILNLNHEPASGKACSACNKQYCQEQLPDICVASGTDSEVTVSTDCFKRQSTKDETIIIAFLLLTGGLLLYATIIKPIMKRRAITQNQSYSTLSGN